MRKTIKVKDIETAIRIYYTCPELGTEEIRELFDCSSSSATRLKSKARALQKDKDIMTLSGSSVNTRCAFEAWGIRISDYEKLHMRYQKIQKGMMVT